MNVLDTLLIEEPGIKVEIKTEAETDGCYFIYNIIKKEDDNESGPSKYHDLITEAPMLCSICDETFLNRYTLLQHNITHMRIHIPKVIVNDNCIDDECIVGDDAAPITNDHNISIDECNIGDDVAPIINDHIFIDECNVGDDIAPVTNDPIFTDECINVATVKNDYVLIEIENEANIEEVSEAIYIQQEKKVKLKKKCICGKRDCKDRSIHKKKLILCDKCDKPLSKMYLYLHKKLMHGNEKLKCEFCSKEYQSQPSLTRHKQSAHGRKLKRS